MKDKIKWILFKLSTNIKDFLVRFKVPLICISVVVVVIGASYFEFTVRLVGDSDVDVNVNGDYEELGFRASYYGKKVEDVMILSNLDISKIGDYTVEYTASKWLFTKRVYRTIHVRDYEKPTIELEGSDQIHLPVGNDYKEPGYKAYDNVDGDITFKVKTSGKVKKDTIGLYEITYTVTDSSGNTRQIIRKVEVTENNYLDCDVDKFWLNDIFPQAILKEQATEIDYFDDIVMIGDCNTYFLYSFNRLITAEQCWGKSNLNISEINNSTFETFADLTYHTFNEAMDKYSPKYLIVNPGLGSPLFMRDTELFKSEILKFIENMKTNYPDTIFVFSAIMPLNDGQLPKEFQKVINTYNYLLAEICYNNNVKMINFADTVRGDDGYGIKENYIYNENDVNDRGFHFNEETRKKLVNYIKHIDIKGGK